MSMDDVKTYAAANWQIIVVVVVVVVVAFYLYMKR